MAQCQQRNKYKTRSVSAQQESSTREGVRVDGGWCVAECAG